MYLEATRKLTDELLTLGTYNLPLTLRNLWKGFKMTDRYIELDGGTFFYHGQDGTYRVNPAIPVGDHYETHIFKWSEQYGQYCLEDEIDHGDMEEICNILFDLYEIRLVM